MAARSGSGIAAAGVPRRPPSGSWDRVTGTIVRTPNTRVTIDAFADTTSDPSGFGEGRFYLGSVRVRTKSTGFAFAGPLPPAGANFLTATTADDAGNTSGFSQGFSL